MVGRLGDPNAGRVTTSSITAQGNLLWQAVEEAFFLNPFKAEVISEAASFADGNAVGWNAATSLSDLVTFEETALTFYTTVLAELSDALGLADAGVDQPAVALTVAELTQFAEDFYITRYYYQTQIDQLRLRAVPALSPTATIAEAVQIAQTYVATWGHQLSDHLRVTESAAVQAYLKAVLSDPVSFADSLLVTYLTVVADGITVTDPLTAVKSLLVLEQLGIGDAALTKVTLNMTVLERARFLDALVRFVAADVLEALTVAPVLVSTRRAFGGASDALGVADAMTPRLMLRVGVSDEIDLTAAQALQMIFQPALADGVDIVGAYLGIDGTFTTWAVNTRVGAVTEYTNYAFNSFARLGSRYLGATSEGLYELAGDSDDGDDIIASLKSGFLQFNSSRFAGMKAVYLGVRGGGEYFLKLVAASGESYTYKVIAEDMETTKIWIGKGLRHRYLSYELISTGQDFDLESIEFVPMLAQRRV